MSSGLPGRRQREGATLTLEVPTMGKVLSHMTMSLDGFIATPEDTPEELFEWYWGGGVTVPSLQEGMTFEVDEASAGVLRELLFGNGAIVSGRRLFDLTDGWGDHHPGAPRVVVVTHQPPEDAARWPNTTFVSGVAEAITAAKEIAGDQDVTIASPDIINQALDLGLVDEVCISLVPVLFGEGIPYFSGRRPRHLLLEDPVVVQGSRALHLRYLVRH
jgi:dihydrofolate reductase